MSFEVPATEVADAPQPRRGTGSVLAWLALLAGAAIALASGPAAAPTSTADALPIAASVGAAAR